MTVDTEERALAAVDDMPDQDEIEAAEAKGKSIEDMAADGDDGEEEEKPLPPMQLPLLGTKDTIGQSWGGARATSSEMRLMGGKQPIEGQFDKGEIVTLVVEAKIFNVGGVDFTDEWGTVSKTVRRHHARIISCRRAEAGEVEE